MTISIVAVIGSIFGSNDSEQTDDLGAEYIAEAVYGNRSVYDIDEAVLGEPVLRDFGSEYFTDYQIVIPLHADGDFDVSPFIFDVPEQPTLDDGSTLSVLAEYFGVESVENIGLLEGVTVPIEWDDGSPSPAANELRSTLNAEALDAEQ